MVRAITLWFRGKYCKFNHLEIGHSHRGTPSSISKSQSQKWKNDKWRKEWRYLEWYDEDEIPKVVPNYTTD